MSNNMQFNESAFDDIYDSSDYENQKVRYKSLIENHRKNFNDSGDIRFVSAPGRTEICGNHTDHNGGRVIAGSITLDTIAAAVKRNDNKIAIVSDGYDDKFITDLNELQKNDEEEGSSTALIKGVVFRLRELGYKTGGFNATVTSNVLRGSGLSSSASFEVLLCSIINAFYNDGSIDPMTISKVSQFAENKYFGKPCGLMDQIACSYGGIVGIDFKDMNEPKVNKPNINFDNTWYKLVIVNTKGNHSDLTSEYASISEEMKSVAKYFGKNILSEVDENEFKSSIPSLRKTLTDRAILRAMHFYNENKRVDSAMKALKDDNIEKYFGIINESAASSWELLQNCYVPGSKVQQISLALAVSREILDHTGACRVHGGGFAGTIQAYVKYDILSEYIQEMDHIFGKGSSLVLNIRKKGPSVVDI